MFVYSFLRLSSMLISLSSPRPPFIPCHHIPYFYLLPSSSQSSWFSGFVLLPRSSFLLPSSLSSWFSLFFFPDLLLPPHHSIFTLSFCFPLPPLLFSTRSSLSGCASLAEAWFQAWCCWLNSSLAAAQWEQVEPPSPITHTRTHTSWSCSIF